MSGRIEWTTTSLAEVEVVLEEGEVVDDHGSTNDGVALVISSRAGGALCVEADTLDHLAVWAADLVKQIVQFKEDAIRGLKDEADGYGPAMSESNPEATEPETTEVPVETPAKEESTVEVDADQADPGGVASDSADAE